MLLLLVVVVATADAMRENTNKQEAGTSIHTITAEAVDAEQEKWK